MNIKSHNDELIFDDNYYIYYNNTVIGFMDIKEVMLDIKYVNHAHKVLLVLGGLNYL